MYIPKHTLITDRAEMFGLMERFSFATLVTAPDGVPFATHLPFLVRPDGGENGTLTAHLARANPQWRHLDPEREVLVIFGGDHAYISPSWYETNDVPTWNYLAVHAYGRPRLLGGAASHRALADLVDRHEEGFEKPWRLDSLPEGSVQGMERAIVAFEVDITRLEGKAKLSQNRSLEDRAGVVRALEGSPLETERAVAEMMRLGLA